VSTLLRRWWPILALLLLLGALQAKLWLGNGGWRDAKALQHTVEEQRAENARLQQRNDALTAEVEDLKSGEAAVEERARSELGMVKPGETFYRVVEPHSLQDKDAAEPGVEAGETAGETQAGSKP
jgi:cell division protein FtsB